MTTNTDQGIYEISVKLVDGSIESTYTLRITILPVDVDSEVIDEGAQGEVIA